MLYVFLKNPVQSTDFRRFAEERALAERVLDSKQAAVEYYLPPDRNRRFCICSQVRISLLEK